MKFAALEDYLKHSINPGNESYQTLEKFLLYASYVQDPLNVFRYMEESSICVYIPLFWYAKSEYLAEIGDYRNAFLCLKKTQEMKEIDDSDERAKILNTEQKIKIYREQISQEMMRFPPNKRRTVSDFSIMSNRYNEIAGSQDQKNQKLFDLLDEKFPRLKIDKEKNLKLRNEKKEKSWLFEKYERLDQKVKEIITESFIRNSAKRSKEDSNQSVVRVEPPQNNERLFSKSVNTPHKQKDPMRFSKTLDSVEILKRKRNTEDQPQNGKKNYLTSSGGVQETSNQNDSDYENEPDYSSERFYNSVPVGKSIDKHKKHVTFRVGKPKALGIELPRSDQNEEKADDDLELTRKTAVVKKGILRNKSTEKKEKKELKEVEFSSNAELCLQLKQTEEQDI